MADMGTKEAAKQWGVSQTLVQKWCREGKSRMQHKIKKVRPGISQKMPYVLAESDK